MAEINALTQLRWEIAQEVLRWSEEATAESLVYKASVIEDYVLNGKKEES